MPPGAGVMEIRRLVMSQSVAVGHSLIATINPYSNEVVREFSPMSDAAVDQAVDAAHEAFASRSDTRPSQRANHSRS